MMGTVEIPTFWVIVLCGLSVIGWALWLARGWSLQSRTEELVDAESMVKTACTAASNVAANCERLGIFGMMTTPREGVPFFRIVEPKSQSVKCPDCRSEIPIYYLGDSATREEVRERADGSSLRCFECEIEFNYKHVPGDGEVKPLWDRWTPVPQSIPCVNGPDVCLGEFDLTYVGLKDYREFVDWLPGKVFNCTRCQSRTLGDDYQHPEA